MMKRPHWLAVGRLRLAWWGFNDGYGVRRFPRGVWLRLGFAGVGWIEEHTS